MTNHESFDRADRLQRDHPIDDYYARAPLLIRLIERRRLAIIERLLGDVSGLDLGEVGCGGGHLLRRFPQARLTAIDPSGLALESARNQLRGYDVRFLHGAVEDLALGSASFDRVVCSEVLEHTLDPELVLQTIARLLRPGGVAVITVPNDPLIRRLKALARFPPVCFFVRGKLDWGGQDYHAHEWTPAAFEQVLSRHFDVVERDAAPSPILPIRACFKCAHYPTRR
jgi:2-polyprenyl-3-methyl-5-hydroxy-6-metoxy-1,4-benzoquinol methylase